MTLGKDELLFLLGIVLAVGAIAYFFGDDDKWICRNERWVAVGEPKVPKPLMPCK